jgi:hypothetical protein
MLWIAGGDMLRLVLLILCFGLACSAVEITTGKMLGKGYEARLFYVRKGALVPWRATYSGSKYRPEAAGRLMNLRVAQALFDDEWLTEIPFDAEVNTNRVIAALDTYREHGVFAINVSLQGGNPGYGKAVPEIKRERAARAGRGKGSLISAFLPDGSLKAAWTGRLLRLQRALDERGMVLVLMYFYEGQNGVLPDSAAVRRAVINATDWLIRHNCRNVIIEIANEYDLDDWEYDPWIPNHIGQLIELARTRFTPDFRLPIGASTKGMVVPNAIRDHADLTMIHGNTRRPEEKRTRVAELFADPKVPGPIFMDEDDNGKDTTAENFAKEIASLEAVWRNGGSWGCMPWRQVQMFPFRFYLPKGATNLTGDLPLEQRDQAYFRAVLEHIRALVFR